MLKTKGGSITQDYVLQTSESTSKNTSLLDRNDLKIIRESNYNINNIIDRDENVSKNSFN